jgi:probable rRNA maturation factor
MISVLIRRASRSPAQNNKAQKIIKSFLEKKKIDNVEVSLVFVKREIMRRLNKQYRGIDRATTVLTFSQQEKDKGQAFLKSPRKLKILGDLIICLEEAEKKGYSLEELLIHGLKNLIKNDQRQSGLLSQISSSKNL